MPTKTDVITTALLDLLFEDSARGRCLVAPDGTILRANAEWLRSTGRALDDVLGAEVSSLLPWPSDVTRALLARARAGQHVELPRRGVRGGGIETWWEGTIDPVPLERGTGLLLSAREVGGPPPPERRGAAPTLDDLYHALYEACADGVLITDPTGTLLRANPAACRALERSERELMRLARAEVVVDDPDSRAFFAERDRTGAATGVLTVRRGDGTEVAIEASSSIILASGERRYACLVFRDVTPRTRAEEALRESEERFRQLAQAMPQVVCVLRPEGDPEYVNPGWIAFSGLDLAATQRAGWIRVVHPDDLPAVRACRRRMLQQLLPQGLEVRFRAADGSYRWFLARVAPIVVGRRVIRVIGAAMEIEERKRAEALLHEQLALKDQLARVAASVPGVICSFRLRPDGSASMPFSAPAIADLYGIPQEELARDMSAAFARTDPGDFARVSEAVAESARALAPWRATFRYHHPTKGLRWISGSSIPSREEDGSVVWHGYVADVTDQVRAEEALREADRRKTEFLGVLSHELRNPLAPIRNSIYLLERRPDGPVARRAHEILRRQTEHLARLVDDLLDVTRISHGKIELQLARLDWREIVRQVVGDARWQFEERGVTLEHREASAPVWVEGDVERLAQMVGNLVSNALKFTPRGGHVEVEVRSHGASGEVRVRDSGVGIERGDLQRIFEPFVQVERTRRTHGGVGIGLALVRELAARHGGTVRAESAGPGQGAELVIELPLAAADARPPQSPASGPAVPPLAVLLVEANADAAATLGELLALDGHRVSSASTGRAALAALAAGKPDVLLCDIGLPDLSGYEVVRALRNMPGGRSVFAVALTGYAQQQDREAAAAAGFDAHLSKPPSLDELGELLGQAARRRDGGGA